MIRSRSVPANLLLAALVLLSATLVGWVGVWALAVSAVLLVVLLLGRRVQLGGDWLARLAATAALLGG